MNKGEQMFIVGKIINTHGIKGEVKVKRITDFSERFNVGKIVYVTNRDGELISLTIDSFRAQNNNDLLHFAGYDSIESVEPFKGLELAIKEEQQTDLAEHEYYYHEIIGCKVMTTTGDELGKIDHILAPGANDVWVVKKGKKEILIPYIQDVVKDVDIEKKEVLIELMEGLLD